MTSPDDDRPDEQTRIDHQPPVFPSVGGLPAADDETGVYEPADPLFAAARSADQALPPPDMSATHDAPAGDGRWRWLFAGLATLAVLVLVGGIALLASPRAGAPSIAAHYAPADTVTYAELSLDLPGDQREKLIDFMSHFPGFADPASFDQKLDDTLNQMLLSSGSGMSWYDDIKPWFGGQLAAFSSTIEPTPGTPPSLTFALTIGDRAALDSQITERLAGADASQEDYDGRTIWTVGGGPSGQRLSFAATDELLLVALRAEDIKTALDVRADRTAGLADDSFFLQQLGALHADRLGTVYLDSRSMTASLGQQLGAGVPANDLLDRFLGGAAQRMVAELRIEGDHLALTSRSERSAGADLPPLAPNRSTDLAQRMPADTLAYAEVRQVGAIARYAIERLLEPLSSASGGLDPRMFEQFLGTQPQNFVDFIDDVGVGVAYTDGRPTVGLVATLDDEVVARQRIERLLTALRGLALFGGGITFEEQQHAGATVTVIGVGGLLVDQPIAALSLTVSSGRLLIGTDQFVVDALDRTAADSLAGRSDYQTALAAGGTANAGIVFVDISALREVAESFIILPGERATYEAERKPFVAPLSHLAIVSTTEGSLTISHLLLYVE